MICGINFPASCFGSTYPSRAAILRANPASDVLPDQPFGQSRSPSFSRSRFPVASIHILFMFSIALAPVRLAAIVSPTLPVLQPSVGNSSTHCWGCHTSQDLSIPTWIQLRHSATVMDDALTNLSLDQRGWSRNSIASHWLGRKQEVSRVVHSARLCVTCQQGKRGRERSVGP